MEQPRSQLRGYVIKQGIRQLHRNVDYSGEPGEMGKLGNI